MQSQRTLLCRKAMNVSSGSIGIIPLILGLGTHVSPLLYLMAPPMDRDSGSSVL